MRYAFLIAIALLSVPSISHASEYCLTRYDTRIASVNEELAVKLRRLDVLQDLLRKITEDKNTVSKEMVEIIKSDPDLSIPANKQRMVELSAKFDTLDRQEAASKTESYEIQDRVVALKGVIPADLQGELRGCIEAVKPSNQLVNTVIQALAILSTGGASVVLPPKSLYVDMGQVLNGYPTGGQNSVINKAREDALNALGLGGNNDIGNTVRDPGRVVRCWFGC